MGNCQAVEAATVLIHHGGNKIERIYCSISANEVMATNPGHYVALVVDSPTLKTETGTPLKQLKLLRPDDTLVMGHVYRLISFEDVLKEFAAKKCAKLGKLIKERGGLGVEMRMKEMGALNPNHRSSKAGNSIKTEKGHHRPVSNGGSTSSNGQRGMGRYSGGTGVSGQWRPALQSIAEAGTLSFLHQSSTNESSSLSLSPTNKNKRI